MKIVETLPNISEGKNKELINRIKDLSENFDKIWFISCKSDEYFNRSFISVVGELNQIETFLFEMVKICVENIDLRNHSGYHPRIGAVDVIPIVPLISTTFDEADNLVKRLAKKNL